MRAGGPNSKRPLWPPMKSRRDAGMGNATPPGRGIRSRPKEPYQR
ncbi:hypothetical protein ALSL_2039 [Aerosticca soli]|uniref:Uncharacterized protein n=1 Tax=Aerosticca soli TaxID=2010829 RepID=A0A2Z6E7N0_9GAMM|nr:hypothetical protein ALSL_2039 [Aerosticca soli]